MDNSYVIPLFVAGSILLVVFIFFLIAYLVVHKNKQNAFLLEKNRLIFEHEKKLLEARMEEHERALDTVSKELHDNVGQLLGFARMNMRVVERLATKPEQQAPIGTINNLLDEVMKDVRHISHSLNGEFIKGKGLQTALVEELEYLKASEKLTCHMEAAGDYRRLPPDEELTIFRIAQEIINNTIKHARAGRLDIRLEYAAEDFTITFTDDGVGFDCSNPDSFNKGIGFINMRERARQMNGQLDIRSKPAGGCCITLALPGLFQPRPGFTI